MADVELPERVQQREHGLVGRGRARVVALTAGISAAIAAVVTYFFDPDRGRARRARTVDRVGGLLRRTGRSAGRTGRAVAAQAGGLVQRVQNVRPGAPPESDAVLAHKVETELFRDPSVDKGRININAEEGVVVLRGVTDSAEKINEIESKVRRIDGVRDVQNLLHLPETPAPTEAT